MPKNGEKKLGYGVMVTLQILVLPFLVRVRIPQQKVKLLLRFDFFLFHVRFVSKQHISVLHVLFPRPPTLETR